MTVNSKNNEILICAGCGFANTANSRFCGRCGALLSTLKTPGHILAGRFEIQNVMESGPGWWSYKAHDLNRNKPVRIREIFPAKGAPFAAATAINNRARKYYSPAHGGITPLLDVIHQKNSILLAYPIRGTQSISAIADKFRKTSDFFDSVKKWMTDIMEALSYMHKGKSPVIIASLRPSSIEIDKSGNAVIADAGFAFLLKDPDDIHLYVRPGFAAPEIFTGADLSPASDLFSAGAIFHHLLSKINPEKPGGESFSFEPLGRIDPAVPVELEKIIMPLLYEDPMRRPRQAKTVLKKLNKEKLIYSPAHKHLTLGIAAYNKGEYKKAAAEFKNASLMDPEMGAALFWRAMTHVAQNDLEKGEKLLTRALKMEPEYQAAYYQRGMIRYQMGSLKEAVADITKAIRMDPADSRALFARAMAYRELENNDMAAEDLDRAVEIDPGYGEAFLSRGLIHYETGKVQKALADFDEAVELNPGDAFAYLCRGMASAASGEYEDALIDFEEAIKLHPQYGAAYMERGIILAKMGMNETALLDLEQSIKYDPDNAEAYFHRGRLYYKFHRYQDAINDMTGYIDEIGENPEALRIRGQAYKNLGEHKKGDKDIEKYNRIK